MSITIHASYQVNRVCSKRRGIPFLFSEICTHRYLVPSRPGRNTNKPAHSYKSVVNSATSNETKCSDMANDKVHCYLTRHGQLSPQPLTFTEPLVRALTYLYPNPECLIAHLSEKTVLCVCVLMCIHVCTEIQTEILWVRG